MTRERPTPAAVVDRLNAELDFAFAIDRYKRMAYRPFRTWSEVLQVAISLGYRQTAKPVPLPTFRGRG